MTTRKFIATAKAGRRISGQPNPGVGNPIWLTDAQAAHELRMGTIVAADNRADRKAAASKKPTSAERAAAKEAEASGEGKPKASGTKRGKKGGSGKAATSSAHSGGSPSPEGSSGADDNADPAAAQSAQQRDQ